MKLETGTLICKTKIDTVSCTEIKIDTKICKLLCN